MDKTYPIKLILEKHDSFLEGLRTLEAEIIKKTTKIHKKMDLSRSSLDRNIEHINWTTESISDEGTRVTEEAIAAISEADTLDRVNNILSTHKTVLDNIVMGKMKSFDKGVDQTLIKAVRESDLDIPYMEIYQD